ncbi:MAG: hypothetical protein P4M14_10785 [Gammaproteobacteria bacterium]|nr:hypothetical protein [Gammaproteobacteria bacterium]
MNAGISVSKLLSFSKAFVFIFLLMASCKASAAYYVESQPVPVVACDTCSRYSTTYVYYPPQYYRHVHHYYHRPYHHYRHVTHHRHSHYSIEVYYVWHVPPPPPPCGCDSICSTSYSCGSCSPCGGGCHVSGCHGSRVYYQPEVVYTPAPNSYDDSPDFDTRTADDFNEY